MITKIDTKTAERLLAGANDIFSLKIASNLKAYDGYDFCEAYAGRGILIGRYYNDLVIRTKGVISDEEMEELSLFLKICGFRNALCGVETGKRLHELSRNDFSENVIFRFAGQLVPENEEVPDFEQIKVNPPLDEVFPVIRDGFPDIDREGWYTDISHKVRHGIAEVYLYKGASVTKTADMNGAAFLAFVATKDEFKGQGSAKGLLRAVGLRLEKQGKEACILCRKELVPFYRKAGFFEAGRTITISNGSR